MALRAWLEGCWWGGQRRWLATLLAPLSWLYGSALWLRCLAYRLGWFRGQRLPVPVIVVGNLIVGGAGKTPTTLAVVDLLRSAGWSPGVISRGYGSLRRDPRPVEPESHASECGDEPLLMRRRTGIPIWVGADRVAAGHALCAAHPEVDVLVADDGLQHLALARDLELIVFDGRGLGNGRLLPAGPLREAPGARPPRQAFVVYNASQPTMHWPGHCLERRLAGSWPLRDWWQGAPPRPDFPSTGDDEPLDAAAGIAQPERFFAMLEASGLRLRRWPLPDHAEWRKVPWPPGDAPILVTEKDAVKLPPTHPDAHRLHVVRLDFFLSEALRQAILLRLGPRPTPAYRQRILFSR